MQAQFRYAPRWAGIALLIVAFLGMAMFLVSSLDGGVRTKELLAGGPLFALLLYGALLLAVNRREITVSPEGVSVRHRPLWTGVRDWSIARESIACAQWRYVVIPSRYGAESGYVAGAETADGVWKDLMGPYRDPGPARQMAEELARIWNAPAVQRSGLPRKRDRGQALTVLAWGGAFVLALLNGLAVELFYSYR